MVTVLGTTLATEVDETTRAGSKMSFWAPSRNPQLRWYPGRSSFPRQMTFEGEL